MCEKTVDNFNDVELDTVNISVTLPKHQYDFLSRDSNVPNKEIERIIEAEIRQPLLNSFVEEYFFNDVITRLKRLEEDSGKAEVCMLGVRENAKKIRDFAVKFESMIDTVEKIIAGVGCICDKKEEDDSPSEG